MNILPAHFFPRATLHVPQMITLIKTLIKKNHAYEKNGNVFPRCHLVQKLRSTLRKYTRQIKNRRASRGASGQTPPLGLRSLAQSARDALDALDIPLEQRLSRLAHRVFRDEYGIPRRTIRYPYRRRRQYFSPITRRKSLNPNVRPAIPPSRAIGFTRVTSWLMVKKNVEVQRKLLHSRRYRDQRIHGDGFCASRSSHPTIAPK
jgi:hypothetical protein